MIRLLSFHEPVPGPRIAAGKADRKSCAKTAWGEGAWEGRGSGASGIRYDSSILTVYVNSYVIRLHARLGKQTWRAVKPSFTAHFASRSGFRFLTPGSSLCFLSFLPLFLFLPLPALLELSPSAISSSASRTSAAPYSPGLPKLPSFLTNVLF